MQSPKLRDTTNGVELADTEYPRSFLLLLNISANLAGKPFQDLLSEYAGGAKPGSFFHKLKKYVFSILGDNSESLHIHHELTTIQFCRRLPPYACQLRGPWADELALYHQPAVIRSVENGDFQHC